MGEEEPAAPEDHTLVATAMGSGTYPSASRSRGPALERGTEVGRYVVLRTLGAGGMGVVYAAYDPELDRKVALKLLHRRPEDSRSSGPASSGQSRLVREAQAIARLSHPNVVTIYDVGTWETQVFIAMEFVDGETLHTWLRDAHRPWRETTRRFIEAGRGLAAAHEAGLVHRDFKPDNVLLGRDGRVRVMDFGLARPQGELEPDDELARISVSSSATLDDRLTRTGAAVGTPAYMAPEQLVGSDPQHEADQFSFCVSLYEGLYGERPFAGETPAALSFNVMQGKLNPAPTGVEVPAWLRRVVVRGLSVKAADRWPSMDALLDQLARDPTRTRRRRLSTVVAAATFGGAIAVGASLQPAPAAPAELCTGAAALLEETWNADRRTRIETAVRDVGVNYGPQAWTRAAEALDAYGTQWTEAHTAACRDTRVRGDQPEETMAKRMACLDDARRKMDSLLSLLETPDAAIVEKAPRAVRALPSVAECERADILDARFELPSDPELQASIAAVRARLADAEALELAGRYEEALAAAKEVARDAEALAFPALEAEAARLLAVTRIDRGELEAAEADLYRAIRFAAQAEDDTLAADAWAWQIYVVGVLGKRVDEAKPIAASAEAASVRAGRPARVEARVLMNRGTLAYTRGEYHEATELLGRAVALREKALGPTHPDVAAAMNNYGLVLFSVGKLDEAVKVHEAALAIWTSVYGPGHPGIAGSLNNLAMVKSRQGEPEAAQTLYEQSLRLLVAAKGEQNQDVAGAHHNLGNVLRAQGKLDEARRQLEHSMQIKLAIFGEDSAEVAHGHNALGVVDLAAGDHAAALREFDVALAGWEKAYGPEHAYLAYALTGQGSSLLGLGRAPEAVAPLERALRIREAKTTAPADVAETCFALAKAVSERTRAQSLAHRAHGLYLQAGKRDEQVAEIETWLRAQSMALPAAP